MKRNLNLWVHQLPAIDYIMKTTRCVLAISPNGGKTEISIYAIQLYLALNSNARILILTHSTNVLLDNFMDRLNSLNLSFSYSSDLTDSSQVHVCIPQNEHLIQGNYDFVIVDEAHENYLADRVQRIIKKVKPKKELLLTGSPSKFIKKGGYDIFYLATNEIPNEYFAKLGIELIASEYSWVGHYNNDLEVKSEFKFNVKDTEKTLENVILKLISRIKSGLTPEEFNNQNIITKIKTWAFAYKKIGKTMFVCKTIKQANMVHSILIKHGVSATKSHSECDDNGNEIALFKTNQYDVLVVVNRARLGYNDTDLMNIIDMSGTHNPDVIYQMFCRCIRGTQDMQKYYLKLTPKELHNMSLTHISVSVALMLTDRRFMSVYNGKNFNNIRIPIIKTTLPSPSPTIPTGTSTRPTNKNTILFPDYTHDAIDMFKNVSFNLDNDVSIYKMVTINEVKQILGHTNRSVWTYERILESARGFN